MDHDATHTLGKKPRGAALGTIWALLVPMTPAFAQNTPPAQSAPPAQNEAILPNAMRPAPALPVSEVIVQVEGITDLASYAAAGQKLGAVPGVKRASLEEAHDSMATFRVQVVGGAQALEAALATSANLTRVSATGDRLIYQYRP